MESGRYITGSSVAKVFSFIFLMHVYVYCTLSQSWEMSKTRKNKPRFASSVNPLGLLEPNDVDEFLSACGEMGSSGVGPIGMEEKLNGLQSFAVLTTRKDKMTAICQCDVVRIAAPFLCEKEHSVRYAAAGALRNLSVNGTEVYDFLVQKDVLTPLLALLGNMPKTPIGSRI